MQVMFCCVRQVSRSDCVMTEELPEVPVLSAAPPTGAWRKPEHGVTVTLWRFC